MLFAVQNSKWRIKIYLEYMHDYVKNKIKYSQMVQDVSPVVVFEQPDNHRMRL